MEIFHSYSLNLNLFFILVTIIFVKVLVSKFFKKEKSSHKWRKKSAKKVLHKIQTMTDAQIFGYLRKIDPFVFEEVILEIFRKNKRCQVVESNRYTRDGGVDGEFLIKENGEIKRVYIQAKRYKNHIKLEHIKEFCYIINKEEIDKGLFIHTGKTGKIAKKEIFDCPKLELISGKKLITLLKRA